MLLSDSILQTTASNTLLNCLIISVFQSWMINWGLQHRGNEHDHGLLMSVPSSSQLFLIMAEESCVPWFHHAWGVVHTWQQAGRQHDSCGKTLSFSEIKTQPSCEILMTRKTFHTKSATPLTVLTFEWQEGYPTLRPWSPPPLQLWEQIMSNMGEVGCQHCQMSKSSSRSE